MRNGIVCLAGALLITSGCFREETRSDRPTESVASAALACLDDLDLPNPSPGSPFGGTVAILDSSYAVQRGDGSSICLYDLAGQLITCPLSSAPGAGYGGAMASLGDRVAVSDANASHDLIDVLDGLTGALVDTIPNPGPGGTGFGDAIDYRDGILIASSLSTTVAGVPFAGTIYVHDFVADTVLTVDNPDPANSRYFGETIAIGQDFVFVTAERTDAVSPPDQLGAIYVLDPSSGYSLVRKITNPSASFRDSVQYDDFEIAVDGDAIYIGSHGNGSIGRAHSFDGPTGVSLRDYVYPHFGGVGQPKFGASVATVSGLIAIAAPDAFLGNVDGSGKSQAGEVDIFDPATGQEKLRITNPRLQIPGQGDSERFGRAMRGANDRILVGAVGYAYVFGMNRPPVATAASVTAVQDFPLTIVPIASDQNADPLGYSVTQGPFRGAVVVTNGTFVYTPEPAYSGPDSLNYVANDACHDSNEVQITINVRINNPPTAGNTTVTTPEDTGKAITLVGNDVDGDPMVFEIVTVPSNGSITLTGSGPGSTYTPDLDFNGTDSFTFKANDPYSESPTRTVTILVSAVNDPPVAVGEAHVATEDTPLVVAAPGRLSNDTDVDSTSLSAVSTNQPPNGTVISNADGSFTYTPTLNYSGPDAFTYRANDGSLSSATAATVSVSVTAVNDAPVANPDAYTTLEDTAFLRTAATGLLGNDTDIDSVSLSATLVSDVSNGTLSFEATGAFTYVPDADFSGTDSFTYATSDGFLASGTTTVTLSVTAVNDLPVTAGDAYGTVEDVDLVVAAGVGVLSNDSDVDSVALTAVLVTPPSDGTLVLSGNGAFTYSPDQNFSGSDSFVYAATDGSNSNPATVSLTVGAIADGPVAILDTYSTVEDELLIVDGAAGVLLNDTDVDSSLSAVLVTPPAHGSLVLSEDGSFVYTPSANYAGPDSFLYLAFDGALDSEVATVTIQVAAANDAPSVPMLLSPAAGEELHRDELVFQWQASSDADGDPITFHFELRDALASVYELSLGANEHTLPEDLGLETGEYTWQVTAEDSSGATLGASPPSVFVLTKKGGGGGGGGGCQIGLGDPPTSRLATMLMVGAIAGVAGIRRRRDPSPVGGEARPPTT